MARGIDVVCSKHQTSEGLVGARTHYTGGGFPRVFYLNYHGYPKFFPLWAAGALSQSQKRANDPARQNTAFDHSGRSPA